MLVKPKNQIFKTLHSMTSSVFEIFHVLLVSSPSKMIRVNTEPVIARMQRVIPRGIWSRASTQDQGVMTQSNPTKFGGANSSRHGGDICTLITEPHFEDVVDPPQPISVGNPGDVVRVAPTFETTLVGIAHPAPLRVDALSTTLNGTDGVARTSSLRRSVTRCNSATPTDPRGVSKGITGSTTGNAHCRSVSALVARSVPPPHISKVSTVYANGFHANQSTPSTHNQK